MLLKNIPIGQKAKVSGFVDSTIAVRLMSMGVLPGTDVTLIRKSVFGNTVMVKTPQQCLALRKNEAANILVENIMTGNGR